MKKSKIIIISIVIVLLIIAGIIGFLYAKTDLFKSNKMLFYKYLAKTQIVEDEAVKVYKQATQNKANNNYSSTGTVTCSMKKNDNATNISDIQQLFTIYYNALENRALNQYYSDYKLSVDNKDVITLRTLKDENTYALKADNVVTNYLALENKDLKSFFAKLGVTDTTQIPDSIPQKGITTEATTIDPGLINNIKTKYLPIINNKLTEDKFIKTVNEDKTTTITLALTEQETVEIIKEILETLKDDDATINLIIQEASNKGYGSDLNADSFKTSLQETIDDFTNGITNGEYSTAGSFVRLSVTENGKTTTGVELQLTVEQTSSPEGSQTLLPEQNDTRQVDFKIDLSEKNRVILYANNGTEEAYKAVITFGYETNKFETNIDVSSMDASNVETPLGKLQYQILDYNSANIKQNITLEMIESSYRIQVDLNDVTELKSDIQIEKITNQNAIKLNNLTAQQLQDLMQKISARLEYLYADKVEEIMNFFMTQATNAANENTQSNEITQIEQKEQSLDEYQQQAITTQSEENNTTVDMNSTNTTNAGNSITNTTNETTVDDVATVTTINETEQVSNNNTV